MASTMLVTDAITTPNAASSSLTPPQDSQHGTARTPGSPPASLRSNVSWKSFRTTFSLSEKKTAHLRWLVALISVLLTIVALSPAFRSQDLSERALRLAEWTALKDYIEECREELAAGIESQACRKAIGATLPPPPYVKSGVLEKLRKRLVYVQVEQNRTIREPRVVHQPVHVLAEIRGVFLLALVLFACFAVFLRFENSRSSPRQRVHDRQMFQEGKESKSTYTASKPETPTKPIRYPPKPESTSLRRRTIRSHPIYQHASLESALYHCSFSEIRLRLQNGEDVNQNWPYLIYKLAISPPTADTPKRLEVARLCLDFGADVNALKGWNGQSALMIAIHFENVNVAKLLIANGAMVDYSPPDSKLTALHRCVRLAVTGVAKDALEIMNMLFKYGADPNQEDSLYETALHKLLIEAWLKRDDDVVVRQLIPVALCLIEHGARLPQNIKDRYVIGNPLWDIVRHAARRTDERIDAVERERRERYCVALYDSFRALENRCVMGTLPKKRSTLFSSDNGLRPI
jgi:hypothetical protein